MLWYFTCPDLDLKSCKRMAERITKHVSREYSKLKDSGDKFKLKKYMRAADEKLTINELGPNAHAIIVSEPLH